MAKVIKPCKTINGVYKIGIFENEKYSESDISTIDFATYQQALDTIGKLENKIKNDPSRANVYQFVKSISEDRIPIIIHTGNAKSSIINIKTNSSINSQQDKQSTQNDNKKTIAEELNSHLTNYVLEKSSLKGLIKKEKENSVEIVNSKYDNNKLLLMVNSVGVEREDAIRYVVNEVKKAFESYNFYGNTNAIIQWFTDKIKEISNKLNNYFGGSNKTPPTALSMAIVLSDNIIVFNVGTSKCFSIDKDDKITLITKDFYSSWNKKDSSTNDIIGGIGRSKEPQIDVFRLDKSKVSSLLLCSDEVKRFMSQVELKSLILKNNEDIADKIILDLQNKIVSQSDKLKADETETPEKYEDASVIVWKKR